MVDASILKAAPRTDKSESEKQRNSALPFFFFFFVFSL
jgi:hypothetical protein